MKVLGPLLDTMLCMSWSPYDSGPPTLLSEDAGRAQDLEAHAGLGLCGGHTLSLEILLCHSIKNIPSNTQSFSLSWFSVSWLPSKLELNSESVSCICLAPTFFK